MTKVQEKLQLSEKKGAHISSDLKIWKFPQQTDPLCLWSKIYFNNKNASIEVKVDLGGFILEAWESELERLSSVSI